MSSRDVGGSVVALQGPRCKLIAREQQSTANVTEGLSVSTLVGQPMEDATEHLVKVYLESLGYVVSTNVKIKLKRRISTS